jgi:hypothetical protein
LTAILKRPIIDFPGAIDRTIDRHLWGGRNMPSKITINSIAKIAKVSKGTVSRVLNNERGVGEKTRARILKLIKELNYKPSAIARSLVSLKTNNIGIVMPSDFGSGISTAFWPRILLHHPRSGGPQYVRPCDHL